jgi:PEP-CTERM motif
MTLIQPGNKCSRLTRRMGKWKNGEKNGEIFLTNKQLFARLIWKVSHFYDAQPNFPMKTTAFSSPVGRVASLLSLSASVVAVALLLTSQNASALSLVLNFGPTDGSSIQFNGNQNSFQFNPGGSAVGLNGSVLNGPFNYGPITISGSGISQVQSATVLGPLGSLVINNGPLDNLTGTVNWINIATYFGIGGLNAQVNVNLSNVSYSGSNPDLQTLQANQPGIVDVSFQFAPGETLTQLSTGTGPYTTSFSGSITTAVPEPASIALAGVGGLTLLLFRRRRK